MRYIVITVIKLALQNYLHFLSISFLWSEQKTKISFDIRNLAIYKLEEIWKKMVSIEDNVIFTKKHESFGIFRWRCWFAFLENISCPISWWNLALSHLNIFGDINHPMDITQLSKENFLKRNCFRRNDWKCRKLTTENVYYW